MERTGQAFAHSLALHLLLAGCLLAISPLRPSPPPITRLDFSLLPPLDAPPAQDQNLQQSEFSSPVTPTPPKRAQSDPMTRVPRQTIATETPAKTRSKPSPRPSPPAGENAVPAPSSVVAATVPTSQPEQSGSGHKSAAETAEAYRQANFSTIRSSILANLRYPMIARRQGWSGKVEIAFEVTPEGGIGTLRVQTSSGYEVLDEEAKAAIRRAAPFTPPRVTAFLVMPVTFKLN